MLQHNQVTQTFNEITNEAAGLVACIHDLFNGAKQSRAITGNQCVNGFIQQGHVSHTKLHHCVGVRDTFTASSGNHLAKN